MPRKLNVNLSDGERNALCRVRDTHRLAYMRERAAALLKIDGGQTARQVALHGLLKPRDTDTVYRWVHSYLEEGIEGLKIKPGRGRKSAFSP